MATIRKIQVLPAAPTGKRKVAAYARVSMESDNLLRSLSNQVSQYSSLIQSHTDWEYAGVYADKGITGTSKAHRSEFNRLVEDCEAGKIELVLTKSISRFARNTVDLLETVRHLKDIGVEAYFEEQHISSLTCDGELMMTLLAAFAQEEAESIRDNVQWSIQKRFEVGIPNGHKRCLGYGWDGEQYIIIPEEAEAVRQIFHMYLDGKSSVQIAKALNGHGIKGINGKSISDYNVRFILGNETYTGDLLLQKRFSPSIGKRAANRGEMPMYRVEEDHEAIISKKTFDRVQERRVATANAMPDKTITCFSGLLKCGYCGHAVCRRNVSNRKTNVTWICNMVDKKGMTACQCRRRLSETELVEIVEQVIGLDYESIIRKQVKRIAVYDDKLVFQMANSRERTWYRQFKTGPHERGCFSRKVYCGECGGVFVRKAYKSFTVWRCGNRRRMESKCRSHSIHENELFQAVQETIGTMDNYEMRFYCDTDRLLVFDDRLEFCMRDGDIKTWLRK